MDARLSVWHATSHGPTVTREGGDRLLWIWIVNQACPSAAHRKMNEARMYTDRTRALLPNTCLLWYSYTLLYRPKYPSLAGKGKKSSQVAKSQPWGVGKSNRAAKLGRDLQIYYAFDNEAQNALCRMVEYRNISEVDLYDHACEVYWTHANTWW